MHSVPRAVALLVILWFLIETATTALLLMIPPIRNWTIRRQFALVVLFPAVVLPFLALVAPFEAGAYAVRSTACKGSGMTARRTG